MESGGGGRAMALLTRAAVWAGLACCLAQLPLPSPPPSHSLNGEMVFFNDPREKEICPACQNLVTHAKSQESREES